jgi:pyridoxal phosphate enzyme (YggS family)
MSTFADQLRRNLEQLRQQIDQAADRGRRCPDEIRIVATTKYVQSPVARQLVGFGHTLLGESRPQELWKKAAELAGLTIEWHLIGHLQRNKIRRTLPLVTLIHSVDSQRLLDALEEEATALGQTVNVLLEVQISGDESKHGFTAADVERVIGQAGQWPHVTIQGLMGMAMLEVDADQARKQFAQLRQLRDRLQSTAPHFLSLKELSMGMSGDFVQAILEGATLVRIGSALFEGIAE